ncbi:MAG TPA: hypothetical protein VGZ26_11490, partial [Pirellulales bacterium]|nr:hypothetical protein [Pirellulales bacterium]
MGQFDLIQSLEQTIGSQIPQAVGLVQLAGSLSVVHRLRRRTVARPQVDRLAGDGFGLFVSVVITVHSLHQQCAALIDQL